MRLVPMRVALPFGERYTVPTIVSDIEHLGNRVAEGDLHQSLFWPMLARLKSLRETQAHERWYALQRKIDDQQYAESWASRYLDQIETLQSKRADK